MFVNNIEQYTSEFLKKRFIISFFKEKTLRIGNIISFISPAIIKNEKFDNVLNFCCEIPDISSQAGIAIQKLFLVNAANYLSTSILKIPINVVNDQMVLNREMLVNGVIQTQGVININERNFVNNAYLFYLGLILNLNNDNLSHKYIESGILDGNIETVIREIEKIFYQLNNTIFLESYSL